MIISCIYTDGSCNHLRKGGYGIVMLDGDTVCHSLRGGYTNTTSCRMELIGFIKTWEFIKKRGLSYSTPLNFYSDSEYFTKGIKSLDRWKKNGWRINNGKPVKNLDIWRDIYQLKEKHLVAIHWVKGHGIAPHNILADKLAKSAMESTL